MEPIKSNEVMDELDTVQFTCCKCNSVCSHIDGTWLPVGIEDSKLGLVSYSDQTAVFALDHRPPEIITSDLFTCYDCL